MIRNRADQFGKNILHDTLRPRGEVKSETEVPPGDAQRIDVWFVPDATRQRAGPRLTGILAALAQASALIELWSEVPNEEELHVCLRKRYSWHHVLEIRDKQRWAMPLLWGISAGRPEGLLRDFGFEPAPEGPDGHYRTAAPGWRVRMVVLSELPRVRETVLLRLLGSRRVRRKAMEDLKALPADAWERGVAEPWLTRLRLELDALDPTVLSPDDKEIMMDIQEWYKQYKRELVEQAVGEAVQQGRLEGQVQPLVHMFERRLARPLTPAERATLVERVRDEGVERVSDVVLDLSPEELAAWLTASNDH